MNCKYCTWLTNRKKNYAVVGWFSFSRQDKTITSNADDDVYGPVDIDWNTALLKSMQIINARWSTNIKKGLLCCRLVACCSLLVGSELLTNNIVESRVESLCSWTQTLACSRLNTAHVIINYTTWHIDHTYATEDDHEHPQRLSKKASTIIHSKEERKVSNVSRLS